MYFLSCSFVKGIVEVCSPQLHAQLRVLSMVYSTVTPLARLPKLEGENTAGDTNRSLPGLFECDQVGPTAPKSIYPKYASMQNVIVHTKHSIYSKEEAVLMFSTYIVGTPACALPYTSSAGPGPDGMRVFSFIYLFHTVDDTKVSPAYRPRALFRRSGF